MDKNKLIELGLGALGGTYGYNRAKKHNDSTKSKLLGTTAGALGGYGAGRGMRHLKDLSHDKTVDFFRENEQKIFDNTVGRFQDASKNFYNYWHGA